MCKNTTRGVPTGEKPLSPQPLLFLLSQLHVPLDDLQDVLRLVVRQARQVQLPAHRLWPSPRRAAGPRGEDEDAAALGAEAETTLREERGMGECHRGSSFVELTHAFQ